MYEYNFDIQRSLLDPMTAQTYTSGATPAPLGAVCRVSAKSLGLILGDSTGRDWLITLMFVRFKATVAGAGRPVAYTSDATYGYHSVTSTYAAGLVYASLGISCHAVAAAGDYGFVQIGGLNGWAVTTAAAAVAIGDVLYWSATNELTVAASDANRLKRVAVATEVDADGGALPVGSVMVNPVGLGAF